MDNTLIDQIAPLNYKIFRGNRFWRTYVFPNDFVMPTLVQTFAYKDSSAKQLLNDQPTITMSGQQIIHEYPQTSLLPVEGYQEILFDGRIVWAGVITTNKDRVRLDLAESIDTGEVLIYNSPEVSVAVPYTGDFLTAEFRNETEEFRNETQTFRDDTEQFRNETVQAKDNLFNNFSEVQADITLKAEQVADDTAHVDSVKESINVQLVAINEDAVQVAQDRATVSQDKQQVSDDKATVLQAKVDTQNARDSAKLGINWRGQWVANFAYQVGDGVSNGGSTYRRKATGGASEATFDIAQWDTIAVGGGIAANGSVDLAALSSLLQTFFSGFVLGGYDRSGYIQAVLDQVNGIIFGIRQNGTVDMGTLTDVGTKLLLCYNAVAGGAASSVTTPAGTAYTLQRLTNAVTDLAAAMPPAGSVFPYTDSGYARSGYYYVVLDAVMGVLMGVNNQKELLVGGVNINKSISDVSTGLTTLQSSVASSIATLTALITSNSLPAGSVLPYTDAAYARSGYYHVVVDAVMGVLLGINNQKELLIAGVNISKNLSDVIAATNSNTIAVTNSNKWIEGLITVAAFGDSLTRGVGVTSAFYFPTVLANLLGRAVYNGGVGGQKSAPIASRQGGLVPLLTVSGNTIPASGGVTITAMTQSPVGGANTITGTLAGVPGTWSAVSGGDNTFTRTTPGAAVKVEPATPFFVDLSDYDFRIQTIWYGRNDMTEANTQSAMDAAKVNIKAAIAASIAFIKPLNKKFIVLGVLNKDTSDEYTGTIKYNAITSLNEELKALYPRNYIDIRRILINAYNPADPTDVACFNNDVVPASLRSDEVHLNNAGYALVAQTVYNFIISKSW